MQSSQLRAQPALAPSPRPSCSGRVAAAWRAPAGAAPPLRQQQQRRRAAHVSAVQAKPKNDAEATTEKYGLEAGLFKVFTSKPKPEEAGSSGGEGDEGAGDAPPPSRTQQAKALLARYGSAYLLTSISFAIVSFAACYALVSAGVDVPALLARFGLSASDTSERVGTAAIAYAAHKALSPVRFPPTVALTPLVAKWLGKDKEQ